ncbi:uncharacterized protein LOC127529232 [Erpetoichthys calabaricus]|uniref:uncharacterized protein LOC127529232 n=1 Tax=Erpetoichthys calabaricus TaxID=27687 RepID=UPI0022340F06|nr:uncharacterized protein LOC127529232 [Erpetoichthys calabaricus]
MSVSFVKVKRIRFLMFFVLVCSLDFHGTTTENEGEAVISAGVEKHWKQFLLEEAKRGETGSNNPSYVPSPGQRGGLLDLEDFNVRTLYDKLEDQNLHLATQLAKHHTDTQAFYDSITQHLEGLKDLLQSFDPTKQTELRHWVLLARNASQEDSGSLSGQSKGLDDLQQLKPAGDSLAHLLDTLLINVAGLYTRMSSEVSAITPEIPRMGQRNSSRSAHSWVGTTSLASQLCQ